MAAAVVSLLLIEAGDLVFPRSVGRSMLYSVLFFYLFQILLYRKYYLKCAALGLFYTLMLAMTDFSILAVCSLTSRKPFAVFLEPSVYGIIAVVIHILVLSFIIYMIYHIRANTFQLGGRYVIALLLVTILILVTTLLIFQYFLAMGYVGLADFFVWGMLVALTLVSFFYIVRLARSYAVWQENTLLNMHNEMLLKSLEDNRKSNEVWKAKIHDYKHHLIYMAELAQTDTCTEQFPAYVLQCESAGESCAGPGGCQLRARQSAGQRHQGGRRSKRKQYRSEYLYGKKQSVHKNL